MNDTMKTRLDQLTNTCDCVHELLVEVQRVSVDIARVLLHAFPVVETLASLHPSISPFLILLTKVQTHVDET